MLKGYARVHVLISDSPEFTLEFTHYAEFEKHLSERVEFSDKSLKRLETIVLDISTCWLLSPVQFLPARARPSEGAKGEPHAGGNADGTAKSKYLILIRCS